MHKIRLEERVCKNNVIYINNIDRDFDNQRLVFRFLGDPEKKEIVRILTFNQVEQFNEYWDEEPDPLLIEQLIGITENYKDENIEYWIRLDQSEMHFFTKVVPQSEDILCESII